jgi:hypothetical protein
MAVYCTNMINNATLEVQLQIQQEFKELCHQSGAFHPGIHLSNKLHSITFSKDTDLKSSSAKLNTYEINRYQFLSHKQTPLIQL